MMNTVTTVNVREPQIVSAPSVFSTIAVRRGAFRRKLITLRPTNTKGVAPATKKKPYSKIKPVMSFSRRKLGSLAVIRTTSDAQDSLALV